jgi:DNA-binding GntR family transcriptional regulator
VSELPGDSRGIVQRQGRGRISEDAYERVRNEILRGEIAPGSVLAEAELAEKLGISRTPVRQALRLLLQEELVEVGARRQLVVRAVSPERRREVFLLRDGLEEVAVREACTHMPLEEMDFLRLLLIRQKRAAAAGAVDEFIDLDEEFHLRIAAGANLPMLVRFLEQLRAFVRLMGTQALQREGRMAAVVAEHERLVDALEQRDAPAAVEALAAHLQATEQASVAAEQDAPKRKPRATRRRSS